MKKIICDQQKKYLFKCVYIYMLNSLSLLLIPFISLLPIYLYIYLIFLLPLSLLPLSVYLSLFNLSLSLPLTSLSLSFSNSICYTLSPSISLYFPLLSSSVRR